MEMVIVAIVVGMIYIISQSETKMVNQNLLDIEKRNGARFKLLYSKESLLRQMESSNGK